MRQRPASALTIATGNIFYLLVYAWDVLEEAESLQVQVEDCTELLDLFARVLQTGTDHLLRMGVDRGYLPHVESLRGIRGRVSLSASLTTLALWQAKAVCEYDEFTHDVLHNRILKSTIRHLLASPIDSVTHQRLFATYERLHQIEDVEITERTFRGVQLNRNNRLYGLLIDVCHLIHRSGLTTAGGPQEFRDFIQDERRMRVVFERFVRNFYAREQTELDVGPRAVKWAGLAGPQEVIRFVPKMQTDVLLSSGGRHIIVECKFVPDIMREHFGNPTLRSPHLYQLFAYVSNLRSGLPAGHSIEGILLYPQVDEPCDLLFEIDGIRIRVHSLNLARHWRQIHNELLALLGLHSNVDSPAASDRLGPSEGLPA